MIHSAVGRVPSNDPIKESCRLTLGDATLVFTWETNTVAPESVNAHRDHRVVYIVPQGNGLSATNSQGDLDEDVLALRVG
jgi:hypothetical protein